MVIFRELIKNLVKILAICQSILLGPENGECLSKLDLLRKLIKKVPN